MSERYPGGLITKTPVTPSGPYETSTASGIWTLEEQAYWRKLNQWPIAGSVEPDPQFNYVTMLLHGDGTNGAQNNTFLDSSTNNFTITRNGNTTQGSFSPYGSNWSNYFDGSGDYLTAGPNAAFALGSGDFTVECWFYVNDLTTAMCMFENRPSNTALGINMFINYSNPGQVQYRDSSGAPISSSITVTAASWNHYALVRSGSTVTLWINGQSGGTVTKTTNFTDTTCVLAKDQGGGFNFAGYLSNFRMVKGTAVYTSAFTPSTTPLTAISGTSILTCADNRFIDDSTNNFTVTPSGNTSVQRFNPFGTATAYSTSVIGGSGYFDGTGDYLQTPTNAAFTFGTGDFQIECWLYPLVTPDNFDFVMNGNGSDAVFWACRGSNLDFTNNDDTAGALSTTYPTLNAWTHLAVVRSGTTVSLYKNGVRQATATSSFNWSQTNFTFMAPNAGTSVFTNGYMSDARILKGSTTYNPSSTTITIPTAPLTAVSGTSVLLNMTNGAIFDNAMMNDLETVGNAQISTSVVKYGTGSLAFDGTGDWLYSPTTTQFNPRQPFTVEFWTYPNSVTTVAWIGSNSSLFYIETFSGTLYVGDGSTNTISTTPPSTSVWTHIALSFDGTTYRLFYNGTSQATSTTLLASNVLTAWYIGSKADGTRNFNGYIDDLRITKGYARYTANFTAPTAAFSDTGPY